jgi:hypothetical protein
LGRGIGALGSFIYAKRYSSWYRKSLLLLMWKLVFVALVCKLYKSYFPHNCEVPILSDHTFCIVTLQVLHLLVIQAELRSICFLFAFFLLSNSWTRTLSSNKAWNPALYCINLTFCVHHVKKCWNLDFNSWLKCYIPVKQQDETNHMSDT